MTTLDTPKDPPQRDIHPRSFPEIYANWKHVYQCGDCGAVGSILTIYTGEPCPLCGETQHIKRITGRWIPTEYSFFGFKVTKRGYWEIKD